LVAGACNAPKPPGAFSKEENRFILGAALLPEKGWVLMPSELIINDKPISFSWLPVPKTASC
jgi:hypothetical protein